MRPSKTWSMHFHNEWLERAQDPRLPPWFRVMALAYARHHRNGHARFRPGEMAEMLVTLNPRTKELVPMNKHNVQRAILNAVEFGLIAESSGSLCLVVPAHAVEGGVQGRPEDSCPLEAQHRSAVARRRQASRKPKSKPRPAVRRLRAVKNGEG